MKTLNNYLNEALIKKDTIVKGYKYFPKYKDELREIIGLLLEERGLNANLNDIDVSKITDMEYLFAGNLGPKILHDIEKIDISEWDVSNVKTMRGMFHSRHDFDCDLSSWNVKKCEDMAYMFCNCISYKAKGIENWKVNNVKEFQFMFNEAKPFNAERLNSWNIKLGAKIYNMFSKDFIKIPSWYN